MALRAQLDALAGGLRHMKAGLVAASRGEAQRAVAEAMAERGAGLIDEGFAGQHAPDGSAWKPPARDYGHSLLDETGEIRGSAACEIGPRDDYQGFQLTFSLADEKAIWHQVGTFRGGPTTSPLRAQNRKSFRSGEAERQQIPARKMIFDPGETPEPWIAALDAVGQEALDRWITLNIVV